MWEVTVNLHARHYHHTINIETHIHTRWEGVSQHKGTDKAGRGGHEWRGDHRIPTFIKFRILSTFEGFLPV